MLGLSPYLKENGWKDDSMLSSLAEQRQMNVGMSQGTKARKRP